ncbi:MAG TPA: V-type ATP synthase subunit K [Kiritimatiellae bacterium]|nr:V-type ATP synthase subunit K [Kiritimatiellia bacterium]
MSPELLSGLGKAGGAAALAFAAVGSALGTGAAGMAAIGGWKKCYAQNKAAPFQLLVFIGAPLTQTIYGMILMRNIVGKCALAGYLAADVVQKAKQAAVAAGAAASRWLDYLPAEASVKAAAWLEALANWPVMLMAGLIGGIAMGASAWMQGKAGASGSDALAETGQGFANYLLTLGVIETVALFVMVFIGQAIR